MRDVLVGSDVSISEPLVSAIREVNASAETPELARGFGRVIGARATAAIGF